MRSALIAARIASCGCRLPSSRESSLTGLIVYTVAGFKANWMVAGCSRQNRRARASLWRCTAAVPGIAGPNVRIVAGGYYASSSCGRTLLFSSRKRSKHFGRQRPRCYGLWHAVHTLVEPVLLRLAGLDPLQADAPVEPPRRQLAQRGGTGRGARAAVVASLNSQGRFSGRSNVQIRCHGGAQTKAKRSGRLPSQGRGTLSSAMPAASSTGLCARRPQPTVRLFSRSMTSAPARTHLRKKVRGRSCARATPRRSPSSRYRVPPSSVRCRSTATFSGTAGDSASKWKKSIVPVIMFSISTPRTSRSTRSAARILPRLVSSGIGSCGPILSTAI